MHSALLYNTSFAWQRKREELMEDSDSLTVNGIRINPDVLRKDSIRGCADARCGAVCCSGGVWLKDDEAPRIHAWARQIKGMSACRAS